VSAGTLLQDVAWESALVEPRRELERRILDGCWSGPGLPRATRALVFAVVARGLGAFGAGLRRGFARIQACEAGEMARPRSEP
jgi:hypothetical protein